MINVQEINNLGTETRNELTMNLDNLSVMETLKLMNAEDAKVAQAIETELPSIEPVIQAVIQAFTNGGRLIYIGAGTSGRLGVLDAAECVPTFGVSSEQVQGLIAGGEEAMVNAVEGAEDSLDFAEADLKAINLTDRDVVMGLSASGRTPYVIGGLKYANQIGATTAALSCNKEAKISEYATYPIEVYAGPEVLTGSTRLKSGTAQKLVLNMISTISMIGIGKVYKNLMVDVQPTNQKLVERSKKIIMEATGCDYETANQTFDAAEKNVKVAIVMVLLGVSREVAEEKLVGAKGFIKNTL